MSDEQADEPATLLCVDDEPNILSALRRLFRSKGYRVLTAESGAAGLALLEQERVDLIISDMRMPEMDGARFLERVRAQWPGTLRLLLTGYADIGLIQSAINGGEIHRYITKPWDDTDMLLVVRYALERRALEKDRARLEALTRQQNEELRILNLSLESKVAERTTALVAANNKLKTGFITTIKIVSGMIELRGPNMAGHARRVADLARRIAVKMGLTPKEVQEIFIAALLHDIGKIGFPDELLQMPANMMVGDKLGVFRKHPVRAAHLLMPLDELHGVAALLRAQMERFDGAGFPDAAVGLAIPLGARVLALASDYDNLLLGAMVQRRLAPAEAKQMIYRSSGKRYDPDVVAAFRALTDGDPVEPARDLAMLSQQLVAGMVLSRDLVSRDGLMLLSAEHVLDERLIAQVRGFEAKHEGRLSIHVWPQGAAP